ncbi:MAG: hypothetical protein J6A59_13060 [Lachnospiraceae bacterium]|nr:hypothetical protein [Lachnospiraceae bacterium]
MEDNKNKKDKINKLTDVIRDFKRYSLIGFWISFIISSVIKATVGNGLGVPIDEWLQTMQILEFFRRLNSLFGYIFLYCIFYLLGKEK